MEKKTIITAILFASFVSFIYSLGVIVGLYTMGFFDREYEGKVVGFYTPDANLKYGIENNILKKERYRGEWICLNTNRLNYEEAVNTCIHEVAHKKYNQECLDDPGECFNMENEEFAEICEQGWDVQNKKLFKLG